MNDPIKKGDTVITKNGKSDTKRKVAEVTTDHFLRLKGEKGYFFIGYYEKVTN